MINNTSIRSIGCTILILLNFSSFHQLRAQYEYEPGRMLGEVILFAGNFTPIGWAACDGQTMAIQHYSALFSVMGIAYGGDGRTTFQLPKMEAPNPNMRYVLSLTGQYPSRDGQMQVEGIPMLAEMMLFAGPYVPEGWLECNGQTLNINNYNALFSLLGTTYGGDGQNTFGLPNLAAPPGMRYIICKEGIFPTRN